MHLLAGAAAPIGAAAFLACSWRRRLPLFAAPVVALWGLAAVLWPAVDQGARTHLLDIALWLLTVTLCVLAVAHTSRTRAEQLAPFVRRSAGPGPRS